jgi:hypothetical protein
MNKDYEAAWKDGDHEANSNSTPAEEAQVGGVEKNATADVKADSTPGKDEYVNAHEELAKQEEEKPMSGAPLERATSAIAKLQSAFDNAKRLGAKHFSHEGKQYSTEEAAPSAPGHSQHQEPETAAAKAPADRG